MVLWATSSTQQQQIVTHLSLRRGQNSPIIEKRSELIYHWEEVKTHLSLRRGQNSPIIEKRSELTYHWEEVRTHLSLIRGQNSPINEKRSELTYHWEEVRTHLSLRRGQNLPIIEKRSELTYHWEEVRVVHGLGLVTLLGVSIVQHSGHSKTEIGTKGMDIHRLPHVHSLNKTVNSNIWTLYFTKHMFYCSC